MCVKDAEADGQEILADFDEVTCLQPVARGGTGRRPGPDLAVCLGGSAANSPLGTRLFAAHGDVQHGSLAVDQEERQIVRLHGIGQALED